MTWQLTKILEPGERLIYWFPLVEITLRPRLLKLFGFLLMPVYLDLIGFFGDRDDPWAFAVTDRRILLRHGFVRRRYLDMQLSDIVDIWHDAPRRRIIFVAADAALQLKCRDESVRRILNAIDNARTEVTTA